MQLILNLEIFVSFPLYPNVLSLDIVDCLLQTRVYMVDDVHLQKKRGLSVFSVGGGGGSY
jgi:hypothetical protein